MLKKLVGAGVIVLFGVMMTAASGAQAPTMAKMSGASKASAVIKDAMGKEVATATVEDMGGSAHITVTAKGVAAGTHGLHVHTVGKCEPGADPTQAATNFTTGGGHFNPDGKKHGLENPDGPHKGDLENLVVAANGTGKASFMPKGVTVAALLDADGSAIVIHQTADDNKTDPSGASGPRIACGVITAAK